jgi:hypothetical protein
MVITSLIINSASSSSTLTFFSFLFKCENGTLTEEQCENGLAYDGHGHVHNYCNYNWAVDCGKRKYDDTPISSPGCLYQYGIYPVGQGCQTTFFKVKHGKIIIKIAL